MESVLDKSVKSSGAASGTLIVIDPKTGEILSMANSPRLEPNKYWEINKLFDNAALFQPGCFHHL